MLSSKTTIIWRFGIIPDKCKQRLNSFRHAAKICCALLLVFGAAYFAVAVLPIALGAGGKLRASSPLQYQSFAIERNHAHPNPRCIPHVRPCEQKDRQLSVLSIHGTRKPRPRHSLRCPSRRARIYRLKRSQAVICRKCNDVPVLFCNSRCFRAAYRIGLNHLLVFAHVRTRALDRQRRDCVGTTCR